MYNVVVQTYAEAGRNAEALEVLDEQQHDEDDHVERPHTCAALARDGEQHSEKHAVYHRVRVEAHDHRDHGRNEADL